MKKIVEFFTSLKLTVALLAFAIVLVFIGTLAQADEGLYGAQAHYFKQWLVIGVSFVFLDALSLLVCLSPHPFLSDKRPTLFRQVCLIQKKQTVPLCIRIRQKYSKNSF